MAGALTQSLYWGLGNKQELRGGEEEEPFCMQKLIVIPRKLWNLRVLNLAIRNSHKRINYVYPEPGLMGWGKEGR